MASSPFAELNARNRTQRTPVVPTLGRQSSTFNYQAFRQEMLRAELSGEISEFYSLCFQAILEHVDNSGFAGDYLEMAESIAASDHERATAAKMRVSLEQLQAPSEAVRYYIDVVRSGTGKLANHLLAACSHSGCRAPVDASQS